MAGTGQGNDPPTAPGPGSRRRGPTVVAAVGAVVAVVVLVVARGADPRPQEPPAGGSPGGGPSAAAALDDPDVDLDDEELGGLAFAEAAADAGLTEPHSEEVVASAPGMTSGAMVADVDGDGDLDLYLTRLGRPNGLYRNDGGGRFTDITATAGVEGPDPSVGSTTAGFADLEGDGDEDLLVVGAANAPVVLYLNDGNGRFRREDAAARGIVVPTIDDGGNGRAIHGLSFHDVDRDGWLDLTLVEWDTALVSKVAIEANTADPSDPPSACDISTELATAGFPRVEGAPPNRSRLFRNDGTGHFVDVTGSPGLSLDEVIGFAARWVDTDGDGWDDLLVTGDGCTSRLFRHLGGFRFEDVTRAAGVGTDENAMGSVVADFDGSGTPDWFVTSIGYPTADGSCPVPPGFTGCSGNRLYLNDGDGTFTDRTDDLGVRNGWWGWGAAFEDFGNDGRRQLVMTNGYVEYSDPGDTRPEAVFFQRFPDDPMRFWVLVDGQFVDAADQLGLDDDGVGHAVVPFDHDGDGDLDLLVANAGEPPRLFRNEGADGRSWLSIALDDPGRPGNRHGVGARVEVVPDDGDAPVVGWITTTGSYESQVPARFHVGLGEDADPVAEVRVHWPGEPTPQVLVDVPPDQVLVVRRR